MNNVSGINEDSLDKLILNFYNYIETIDKNFDNILDVIEKLKTSSNSDCIDELLKKMNNSQNLFKKVNNKLFNYVNELSDIKLKYQDISDNITNNVRKKEDNLTDDFKVNNN